MGGPSTKSSWEIYSATPSANASKGRAYGALTAVAPRLAGLLFVAAGAPLVPDPVPFGDEGETTAPPLFPLLLEPLLLEPPLLEPPLLTPPVEEGGVCDPLVSGARTLLVVNLAAAW